MKNKLPLILAALSVATIGVFVLSRGWQTVSQQIEPQVGRECFETHRPLLPVGSQYEGYEATEDAVQVKVMTGTEVRTVECALTPSGTLTTTTKQ